jgi:hypothetical protein
MKISIIQALTYLAATIVALTVVSLAYFSGTQVPLSSADGFSAFDCSISTSTAVIIGPQVSTTILAKHSRRAWATIQQPRNATNTVALSFSNGDAAVLGRGYQLFDIATSTGEASQVSFGLNTDLPYTGAVTGITSVSSTTVLVTECRYNR